MRNRLLTLLLLSLVLAPAQARVAYGTATASDAADNGQGLRGYAGSTFGSPLAFGGGGGSIGFGLFGIRYGARGSDSNYEDGSAGLTIGLGDPDRFVGLESSVGISSVSGHNGGGFGDDGSFGFKLHTNLPQFAALAVGVTDVAAWGGARETNSESFYAAVAKVFPLTLSGRSYALVANLGVGDNQFTRDTDGVSPFGSLAFFFGRQVSLIVDHSGRFLNGGLSVAPLARFPLSFTVGGFNLGKEEGLKRGIAASLGMGYHFSGF
jgi:hypothetical protein